MKKKIKFVKYDGNGCPVEDSAMLLILCENGDLSKGLASVYDWNIDKDDNDWNIKYFADVTKVDTFIIDSIVGNGDKK